MEFAFTRRTVERRVMAITYLVFDDILTESKTIFLV